MKRIVWMGAGLVALASAWASGCSSDDKSEFGGNGGNAASGGQAGNAGNGGSSASGGGGVIGRDGGAGDSGGQGDASCGLSSLTATPRQVNILLVIDKSYSMVQKPSGFSTDKWTAMKDAIKAVVAGTKSSIDYGLELYPIPSGTPSGATCGDKCCETSSTLSVPVEDGPTGAPKIEAKLNVNPGGGTPTAAALDTALGYFTTGAGASLKGDRFVLLATDGGPNCNKAIACSDDRCTDCIDNFGQPDGGASQCKADGGTFCGGNDGGPLSTGCLDDAAAKAKVQALASAKVQTFVVGIPGSEAYEATLNALATAGGRAQSGTTKYYAVSASGGVTGLRDVLLSITRQLITTCRLQLTSQPPSLALLNVHVDGKRVLKGPDGWDLDQTTVPATIVLKGSTCTQVETKGVENVQVVYGCPTESVK
jgi:hypothetical protein